MPGLMRKTWLSEAMFFLAYDFPSFIPSPLDGKLVDQRVDVTLPAHLDDRMYIGSASPNTPDALFAEAVIDDFAIYKE